MKSIDNSIFYHNVDSSTSSTSSAIWYALCPPDLSSRETCEKLEDQQLPIQTISLQFASYSTSRNGEVIPRNSIHWGEQPHFRGLHNARWVIRYSYAWSVFPIHLESDMLRCLGDCPMRIPHKCLYRQSRNQAYDRRILYMVLHYQNNRGFTIPSLNGAPWYALRISAPIAFGLAIDRSRCEEISRETGKSNSGRWYRSMTEKEGTTAPRYSTINAKILLPPRLGTRYSLSFYPADVWVEAHWHF